MTVSAILKEYLGYFRGVGNGIGGALFIHDWRLVVFATCPQQQDQEPPYNRTPVHVLQVLLAQISVQITGTGGASIAFYKLYLILQKRAGNQWTGKGKVS